MYQMEQMLVGGLDLSPVITGWLGSHWGKLVFSVIHAFWYIAFFPLLLKLFGEKEAA